MSGFVDFGIGNGLLRCGDGNPQPVAGGYVTRVGDPGGASNVVVDSSEPSAFLMYSVEDGGTGGLNGPYIAASPQVIACVEGDRKAMRVLNERGVVVGANGTASVLAPPQNRTFAFEDYETNCVLAMSQAETSTVYAPQGAYVTLNSLTNWDAGAGYFGVDLPTTTFAAGNYPALGWNTGQQPGSGQQSLALVAFITRPPVYNDFAFPVYCSVTSSGDDVNLRVYPTDGDLATAITLLSAGLNELKVTVFVSAMSATSSIV